MKTNRNNPLDELLRHEAETTRPDFDDALRDRIVQACRESQAPSPQPVLSRSASSATRHSLPLPTDQRRPRGLRLRYLIAGTVAALFAFALLANMLQNTGQQNNDPDHNTQIVDNNNTNHNTPMDLNEPDQPTPLGGSRILCSVIADTAKTPDAIGQQFQLSLTRKPAEISLVSDAGLAADTLMQQIPWGLVDNRNRKPSDKDDAIR